MVRQPKDSVLSKKNGSTYPESIISISILFLLFIILLLIFLKQTHFDEKYFEASVLQAGQDAAKTRSAPQGVETLEINVAAPEGYSPMSEQENFDQITLSDKIDGKADGYLQAGFLGLATRRFSKDSDQNRWFEFYLYDMGAPRNAFSVYSSQKREGVTPRDFTEFAYSTDNALFFACGRLYVEMISAVEDPALIEELITMAEGFIKQRPADNAELPELAYLPVENLDRGSISLLSKNGFGYDKFDNIITATYQMGGSKLLAFISIRETAENAEALARGYDETLSEFVGKERLKPETHQIPGLVIADVFGEYEIFFARGNIIAGVHSAADKKLGEGVAAGLYQKISGQGK
jgi:hypothetical protein